MSPDMTSLIGAGLVGLGTAVVLAYTSIGVIPAESWAFAGESIVTAGTTLGSYYALERR